MGETKERRGFLALACEHDRRLAGEAAKALAVAPVEELVIKEDYEDAPPETRVVGRVLFLDLHTPASRIEDAATWSAVLAPDGDSITF